MCRQIRLVISVLVTASLCTQAQEIGTCIPNTPGTTLTGAPVSLPGALRGKTAVLVLGFSRASQGQVAAWGKRLTTDYAQSATVMYFEMPMLGGAPRILRGMIEKGMNNGVAENERPHFLPVNESDQPWRAVAHYDQRKGSDAYVLLVDGAGTVLWRTEGEPTDGAYAELKVELKKASVVMGGR